MEAGGMLSGMALGLATIAVVGTEGLVSWQSVLFRSSADISARKPPRRPQTHVPMLAADLAAAALAASLAPHPGFLSYLDREP
jgi:hypothetical protein